MSPLRGIKHLPCMAQQGWLGQRRWAKELGAYEQVRASCEDEEDEAMLEESVLLGEVDALEEEVQDLTEVVAAYRATQAARRGAVPAPAPAAGDAANVAALEALAVPAGVVSVGRAEPTAAAVEQRLSAVRAGGTTRGAKRAAPATSTPAGSAKTQRRRRSRRVAAAARGGGRSSGGAVPLGAGAA